MTTVAMAFEELGLSEEIVHFLERDPGLRVVGTAADPAALSRLVRDERPAVVVGSPSMLAGPAVNGEVRFAVAERETVASLRDAIRSGVSGFYLWPEERAHLAGDAIRLSRRREELAGPRGRVVAVYGPRGGAGATFLATHLAAACASRGARTCLVDCDAFFADVTSALGVAPKGSTRTIADLLPLLEELSAEHLDEVLYEHPRGFRVLLAPNDPASADAVQPAHLAAAVGVLTGEFDLILLHLPRSMDDVARSAVEMADEVLLVVTLDVLAFRDAKRALTFLGGLGLDRKCRLVINRAARSEVVPEDVERVFGMRPAAVLAVDRAVTTAQNRGELLIGRSGRTARRIAALAGSLVEPAS
ncbi:MAG TPA: AAA family ATPase [Actinomycetota bacterium]|nr:AAA family ATPase [Actinomycetota bacterium]